MLQEINNYIINFGKLIDNSYSGITLLNNKHKVIYRSPSAERITGWEISSLSNHSIDYFVHDEDKPFINNLLHYLSHTPGASQQCTFRLKHAGGHYIWLECTLTNMLNEHEVNAIVCNFIDVTEKKAAEELLKKTLHELSAYKKALDESSIVAITDQKGIIKHVNQNFCNISKYPVQELLGQDHRIINSGYHDKAYIKNLWTTIANGNIWKGELRNKAKDGSIYWVDTSIVPFLNAEGKPYQYVAIRSDITQRKLNEIKLKHTSESLIHLLETISDGYISLDKNLCYTYANQQIGQILNINPADLIGKCIWNVFPQAVNSDTYHSINKALTQNVEVIHEDYYAPLNLWHENRIYPTPDGLSIFVRDITQRKKEEQHLKLLESVVTNTSDSVLITSAEPLKEPGPQIIYINEAFTKMTGYTADEVIGRSPRFLQGAKTSPDETLRIANAMQKGIPVNATLLNYKKNGEEFWNSFTISPVSNQQGQITHFIAIEREVTQWKNKELQKNLLADISMAFNKAQSLPQTLNAILQKLANFGNLWMAEAWLVSADKSKINLEASYAANNAAHEFYKYHNNFNSFNKDEGLPGKTWQAQRILHWQELATHPDFLRREAALQTGLNMAYGVPLVTGNDVIGVLVLGLNHDKSLNAAYMGFFEKFGSHLCFEIKRKQLENELNQIFNSAPDVICIIGANRSFKTANPAMCTLLEYSYDEIISKRVDDLIHSDDLEPSKARIQHLINSTDLTLSYENRYITRSGKIKWLLWTATNSTEKDRIFCVAKDITDKKQLEINRMLANKAVNDALEEKRTILESIGDGFFALDRNWTVTYWNKMATKGLGMDKEAVIGKNLWDAFPAARGTKSWDMYHEVMATGRAVHFEDYYLPLDAWYEVSAYPSTDGISVYFKNVTERVNYVKAIEAKNKKLTEISWMQSHVIRAPLSRIMGLVQLVQSVGFKDEESGEILNYLIESAHELDNVIKNITDKTQTDE
ncbi:PAS domain S-box protein [Mucilaginibacter terrae]|uniref:histidine kinase n=1 Tax=Mucilaginibacter terrae TaxID=1955052 RepID=A0ABU3GPU5_9SPHI|nr:PAS domain S-box protein [Mucilaginibacter terrae]MDT3401798.1 PAS domain S-box-containing protein [Mucilaginibacter terrae]